MQQPVVAILADDLIWSTRLADTVGRLGRPSIVARDLADLAEALPLAAEVIVDLTARDYDGISAVEVAAHGGHRVLCVAQHDDRELRMRAVGAGAEHVYSYRMLFERGPETLGRWLATGSGSQEAAE